MRKIPARGLGEKRVVLNDPGTTTRPGWGFPASRRHSSGGRPVGASGIEWIEDDVAALGRIELVDVFEGRVVDDGGVGALFDLTQNLSDQGGLPGPGIAHDRESDWTPDRAGFSRRGRSQDAETVEPIQGHQHGFGD